MQHRLIYTFIACLCLLGLLHTAQARPVVGDQYDYTGVIDRLEQRYLSTRDDLTFTLTAATQVVDRHGKRLRRERLRPGQTVGLILRPGTRQVRRLQRVAPAARSARRGGHR